MPWTSGTDDLVNIVRETRTFNNLELEFRVPESNISVHRDRASAAGRVETLPRNDGGFDAFDTSDDAGTTANTIEMIAPPSRSDVRPIQTWHINEYEEELVGSSGNVFEVVMNLTPTKEKRFDNEYGTIGTKISDTNTTDNWFFDFEQGQIGTQNVSADLSNEEVNGIEIYEVEFIGRAEEARIVEESCSLLNAIQIRKVPDGGSFLDDFSPDDRHFVSIFIPDSFTGTFPSDDYLVMDWETIWVNSSYTILLELARKV